MRGRNWHRLAVKLAPLPLLLTLAGSAAGDQLVTRPATSGADGFFVKDGTLYDANGNAFRIRGVNRLHWDSSSGEGIAHSRANTVRWDIDFTRPASANINLVRSDSVAKHIVPIVGNWTGTCSSDPAKLATIVSTWVSQARDWTRLNHYLIVNIANEWGPENSPVWRDAYVSAVGALRAAGYVGTLLIDAGGCGQDEADLLQYSQAVLRADPQHNVMFALHLYGRTNEFSAPIRSVQKGNPTIVTLMSDAPTHPFAPGFDGSSNSYSGITAYQVEGAQGMTQLNGKQPAPQNVGGTRGAWTVRLAVDSTQWGDYAGGGTIVDHQGNYALRIARLAALAQRTGAPYLIGEFGPGGNLGPSGTLVTPAQIITTAEAAGIGWLAWAWDDNNLPGARADDRWFSMTYSGPGIYQRPSDLTAFGRDVVLNARYGLAALAQPASIFERSHR